jgi:predicted enzyme related to lactoylglutathione lyase
MTSTISHFEVYGPEPAPLADFYRGVFGWRVEPLPGVNYWRIRTVSDQITSLHCALTFRAIPGLNGFMLYVNVPSLDQTVARVQSLGGSIVRRKSAVPGTAWVSIVADPAKNIFGVWQADSSAFATGDPD